MATRNIALLLAVWVLAIAAGEARAQPIAV